MKLDPKKFIQAKIREIKNLVKSEKAIVALSGGVDSSTTTMLAHKAIGNKLTAIFIDDGLMRESDIAIVKTFKNFGIKIESICVKEQFFKALKGIEDPEAKRKAFRETFYKVFGNVVKKSGANFLLQGTIAADVLETKGGVKTQHNVLEQIGIDPENYGLKILEPLKELYKFQVRVVAKELGLPEVMCQRQPFPGPGLATRIVGEVTPTRVAIVRKAGKIVEEETKNLKPFQAFAVLLKDKATGIKDGKRIFGNIIAIRCINSRDALTAKITKIPWEILERIQLKIINEIPSVVKVVYDITPKPPSTIEYI